jgi:hypothetical protein
VKTAVVPFLIPPEELIIHGGWQFRTPAGDTPLPSELPHWDYQTVLEMAASVSVNRNEVLKACELGEASRLSVLVMAHSDHTRTERSVAFEAIPPQDAFDLRIQFNLPGGELGGRLTLDTYLVVSHADPLGKLAPTHPGSILWRSRTRTELEGVRAQFPTEASDFSKTYPLYSAAAWVLDIDMSDVDALFMAAARLNVNSGHPAVGKLLESAPDEGTAQLWRTLRWDVTRQMVGMGLAHGDVVDAPVDPEAKSVSGVLRNLLATIWPHEDPITVRGWLQTDPVRVEAAIQNYCRILP